jgi:hypothetical protein
MPCPITMMKKCEHEFTYWRPLDVNMRGSGDPTSGR